jgi:hypothetical protein
MREPGLESTAPLGFEVKLAGAAGSAPAAVRY